MSEVVLIPPVAPECPFDVLPGKGDDGGDVVGWGVMMMVMRDDDMMMMMG